jgi:hypothetical protein
VRPLIVAGAISSWLGLWFEVLRPAQGKWEILRGTPVRTIAVVGGSRSATLLRLDKVERLVRQVAFPGEQFVLQANGHKESLRDALSRENLGSGFAAKDVLGRAADIDVDEVIVLRIDQIDLATLVQGNIEGTTLTPRELASVLKWLRKSEVLKADDVECSDDLAEFASAVRMSMGLPEWTGTVVAAPGGTWWP